MVLCLVVKCHARSGREKGKSFFRVPSVVKNEGEQIEELTIEWRRRWISAIAGKVSPRRFSKMTVCCRHFVSRRPAARWDKYHIDWVPTLHLGHNKVAIKDEQGIVARSEREKARQKCRHEQTLAEAAVKVQLLDIDGKMIKNISFDNKNQATPNHEVEDTENKAFWSYLISSSVNWLWPAWTQTELVEKQDSDTQTEAFEYMFFKSKELPFDPEEMRSNEGKVRFYTRLVYFQLRCLYLSIAPCVFRKSKSLTQLQVLVMVLMKLRLNMPFEDLAYRFGMSVSTISRLFAYWIPIMDIRLSPLILWPDR